jgi:hypothetical protein
MQVTTQTRIIIGASAYASIRYTTLCADAHGIADDFHVGTIDFKLPGGRGAAADLRRIADEEREKAARHLRHAEICESAAMELDAIQIAA